MGNESGTWVMYGVYWDDPECIHTVEEATEYINRIGFLPLFKNDIKGFRWKSEQSLNIGGVMMLTKIHGFGEL